MGRTLTWLLSKECLTIRGRSRRAPVELYLSRLIHFEERQPSLQLQRTLHRGVPIWRVLLTGENISQWELSDDCFQELSDIKDSSSCGHGDCGSTNASLLKLTCTLKQTIYLLGFAHTFTSKRQREGPNPRTWQVQVYQLLSA